MATEADTSKLDHWSSLLRAMPIPAALVDDAGFLIIGNRWIESVPGEPLITPNTDEASRGVAFGVDARSRWRVRPLDDRAEVLLATAEREDAGDHLLRKFFGSSDALFVVYDQAGRIIQSNAAWEQMLGYTHDDVFGIDSWTLLPPDDLGTRAKVEAALRADGRCEPSFRMRAADGTYRIVQWALHFDASVGRCFGIGRDVTDEGQQQLELERRANTDELTGLANRASFLRILDHWLSGPKSPAILFCDLDHFKFINDSLGHQCGDELLAGLGRRLLALRDSEDAVVARIGGDEFVVLLGDADEPRAIAAADEILRAMQTPLLVDRRPVHVGMSIGVAVTDNTRQWTADELLAEADTAAYKAKGLGRNRFVVFDETMREGVERRFRVEEGLRRAIKDQRFELHYQPIVRLPDRRIVGVEALVRWRTPDGELLGPGRFLDVAEDAGLMPEIGDIVLRTAMAAGHRLSNEFNLFMSINVSSQELSYPGFVGRVFDGMRATGIDPRQVLIEITESSVLTTDATFPVLQQLREFGFRLGLDDFGTGFSSLAHLRELPIDVVKVDRTFVADLATSEVTHALTSSIVELCKALGLDVILEGIETREHVAAVEAIGGTMAQGYHFHKPAPFREVAAALLASPTPIIERPAA